VAFAPSLNLPSPHALTAAKVQLATFADVLSVPAVEWTDLLFGNTTWGGVLSSTNYGDAAAKPQEQFGQVGYVNPWATFCDGSCTTSGITGAAYLFFDALVNGNGQGYDNVNKWNTSVVNYWFEPNTSIVIGGGTSPYLQFVSEGNSAATWYLLQTTLGKAIPALTVPMSAAFWGPHNTTVFYNLALSVAAVLVGQVPAVGPFAGNSILAYLGDLPIPNSGGNFYQYGLSGTLNYWVDIATGSVPWPTSLGAAAATRAAAATTATTAAPAAAAAAVKAPEAPAVSNDAKPESTPASKAPESTPEVKAPESTPEVKAPASTPAADAPESTPEVKAPASTPAADAPESTPEVKAPASTPAADAPASTPAADAPASTPEVKAPADAPAATDTTPAKPARPHPVRDAVEKVGKQISDALGGAKAKAGAAKAGAAATRGSDSAS
jgi:hypothetical protein